MIKDPLFDRIMNDKALAKRAEDVFVNISRHHNSTYDLLRVLQTDLLESKAAMNVAARIIFLAGYEEPQVKNSICKVTEMCNADRTSRPDHEQLDDAGRILFFARTLIEVCLALPAVKSLLQQDPPVIEGMPELLENQFERFRFFNCTIPMQMKQIIRRESYEVFVLGFNPPVH